jgi:hypothetical protein
MTGGVFQERNHQDWQEIPVLNLELPVALFQSEFRVIKALM